MLGKLYACMLTEGTARRVEQGTVEAAGEVIENIDAAADQTREVIGAVEERIEGAIDDAPRQTAAIVQQVSGTLQPVHSTKCVSPLQVVRPPDEDTSPLPMSE
jgi:hypothetical protein